MTKNISNKIANQINWKKVVGLVPAVIQDASNGLVLMLGYMNKEALEKTVSTSFVWFYSRTKKRLWMKGEESGNTLKVKDILLDCDGDTLLVKAIPNGPTCHTGERHLLWRDRGHWFVAETICHNHKPKKICRLILTPPRCSKLDSIKSL